ncbi:MAG: response regulator transcription factor [Salinispira sp.]
MNYTDTCILLVEDDKAIAESLISGLQLEQYTCFHCSEAQTALETVQKNRVDIALLDIRLPGMDGLQLCRKFRDDGYNFPIIMLTARDEEIDKILGLEMGADDYMVKPYSFRELLSRIRAHLRRSREYPELSGNSLFLLGDVQIDRMRMRVYRNNKPVDITPVEFRLLTALITYESQPLSREQIIRQVWGENFYLEDPRTVDVHIRHLREKLESDPSQPAHIQTVRGFGYRLVKNP